MQGGGRPHSAPRPLTRRLALGLPLWCPPDRDPGCAPLVSPRTGTPAAPLVSPRPGPRLRRSPRVTLVHLRVAVRWGQSPVVGRLAAVPLSSAKLPSSRLSFVGQVCDRRGCGDCLRTSDGVLSGGATPLSYSSFGDALQKARRPFPPGRPCTAPRMQPPPPSGLWLLFLLGEEDGSAGNREPADEKPSPARASAVAGRRRSP